MFSEGFRIGPCQSHPFEAKHREITNRKGETCIVLDRGEPATWRGGYDLGTGPDRQVYRCQCGFETGSGPEFSDHMQGHLSEPKPVDDVFDYDLCDDPRR